MKTKLFVCLIFACLIVSNTTKAQVNVSDSLALVDLYNSTGGAGWFNHTNWLTKKPLSSWYGITVTNNRVSIINFFTNHLTGVLPSSLGSLTNCRDINLSSNLLSGTIPLSLTTLDSLHSLFIDGNQLSGSIPYQLSNLSHLISLSLGANEFTGNIPVELGNLSHLQYLALNHNQLTGNIPNEIGNLTELVTLDLGVNQLTGRIPSSLGNLKYLDYLYLSYNKLGGPLPLSLRNLRRLEHLQIGRNNFSGEIPIGVITLPMLYDVDFSHNGFTQKTNDYPDSAKIKIDELNITYNKYTFNGLEYLVSTKHNYQFYQISPQVPIPIHIFNGKLAVSAGGTLSKNTYTWFKAGETQSATKRGDSTFQPTGNGKYYAHITNAIVTDLTLTTDTITYTMPLEKNEFTISLSPNPAKDRTTIHGLNEKSSANITIADMSGYTWVKTFSRQQSALAIDISRLKAGNYLVNVNDGKDVKTIQFVKE